MEWLALFIPLILECLENRDKASLERVLRNPGRLERVVLRSALRRKPYRLRGPELREAVAEGMAYLKATPPETLSAVVETCVAERLRKAATFHGRDVE